MIKKRGRCKTIISVIFLVALLTFLCFEDVTISHKNWYCDILWILVPSCMLTCVIQRLYVFIEELKHYKTRYAGSICLIVQLCFWDQYTICLYGLFMFHVISLVVIQFRYPSSFLALENDIFPTYVFAIITALLLSSLENINSQVFGRSNVLINVKLKTVPSNACLWANAAYRAYYKPVVEGNQLDGYKDIRERICEFEKQHEVIIPLKKLVLVIPLSCDVRGTIDKYQPDIEYVGNLPPIINDQGANVNRRYLNPVYKITFDTDKPLYIAMEQPSPLLTLWKMRKIISQDILRYQADVFIKVLREELSDSDCIILEYDDNSKESLCQVLKRNISRILVEDEHKCQLNIV